MIKKILVINFILILMFQVISAQSSNEAQISLYISEQAKKYNGEEFPDAGKIIRGDLNGDNNEEIIALYTLESFGGSNDYLQYLAIFEKTKAGKLKFLAQKIIGGKNQRTVESVSIENGKINLGTLNYLASDASCSPSKKEKIQVTLKRNKLTEVKFTN